MTPHPTPSPLPEPVRSVPWYAPLRWLIRALADWRAHPGPCLAYGLCFAGMGGILGALLRSHPSLMLTLMGGFLLVGPFLAMGVYEVARRRARGLPCSLADTALAWRGQRADLALLGIALGIILALWARASMVVLAITLPRSIPRFSTLLDAFARGQHSEVLVSWIAVGGLFAGLVYLFTVVAIPMMLDQGCDAITAVLTSARTVARNPAALMVWAALITLLTALGFATFFVGLVFTIPWIGLASWHAYRELISVQSSS